MAIAFRYPSLISLGGQDLTDEGRSPITEQRDERSTTVELASGRIRKYVKGVHRKWDIEWVMMPKSASKSIDGKAGRDELRALADGASTLTFLFRDGNNTPESYTVYIEDYSEIMTLRRGPDSRFRVTLSLGEQG